MSRAAAHLSAVECLRVKHIVTCGHDNCGGVKASLDPSDMGQLNNWLRTLRDVYRLRMAELDAIIAASPRTFVPFNKLVLTGDYQARTGGSTPTISIAERVDDVGAPGFA